MLLLQKQEKGKLKPLKKELEDMAYKHVSVKKTKEGFLHLYYVANILNLQASETHIMIINDLNKNSILT